jgi:hypothetical protein
MSASDRRCRCNVGRNPTREFRNKRKGEMGAPRPRSRVHKNARRVLGSDDAMAKAKATRARMTTGTDDGEYERGRGRGLREGGRWRGRALARSLGRNDRHTNQNEREVGRGCLTNTQRKRKGETLPGPPRGQTRGVIYQTRNLRQVFYGKTGELRREKRNTNGASGWTTIYIRQVLSKPAKGFPNPSPTKEF